MIVLQYLVCQSDIRAISKKRGLWEPRGGSLPCRPAVPSVQEFVLMSLQVDSAGDNRCWYAIRVQSRFESVVSMALRGKGYEEFLPVYRTRRRWSDRFKDVDLPLFPGYLFCRFDVTGRLLPILTTPGLVSIVGAGRTPVPVPDE